MLMFVKNLQMLYTTPVFQTYVCEGIKHLRAQDATQWLSEEGIFLDIRELSEHVEGLPVIENTYLKAPLTSFLSYIDRLPKHQKIVVMCAHGIRSAQLTHWLNKNGWQHAVNLDGGFEAYQSAGLLYK